MPNLTNTEVEESQSHPEQPITNEHRESCLVNPGEHNTIISRETIDSYTSELPINAYQVVQGDKQVLDEFSIRTIGTAKQSTREQDQPLPEPPPKCDKPKPGSTRSSS